MVMNLQQTFKPHMEWELLICSSHITKKSLWSVRQMNPIKNKDSLSVFLTIYLFIYFLIIIIIFYTV